MARHGGTQAVCSVLGNPMMILAGRKVEEVIRSGAAALEAAGLTFGHGTDNALDDAAEIVFFAAGLRHEDAPGVYSQVLTPAVCDAVCGLFERRIVERIPTAYLTQRMWFAGHEFYVDERVLVPRSPIAELIETHFVPWLEPTGVRAVADIGTGSGCIAVAIAQAFPETVVDAVDISPAALDVARLNIERHGLEERVRAVLSDGYAALGNRRYDLIVSNPPYVSTAEMAGLPPEYLKEPDLGLRAGADGLDIVRRLLAGAEAHLEPNGILVVEVGDSQAALAEACPDVPFTWLEFERGGGGIFLLTAEEILLHRQALQALTR